MATRNKAQKKKAPKSSVSVRPIPSFKAKSELARYVDPDELMKGGRVSSGAFLPNPGDPYLSVNSTEVESLHHIRAYYRTSLHKGVGPVIAACRKISDYNNAGNFAGISITFNNSNNAWEYSTSQGPKPAYKHRRTPVSYSHCGVEYINDNLHQLVVKKISRQLAGKILKCRA